MGPSTNSIIDYFGASKHFSGRKERTIFDGEANWLGVVNVHCTNEYCLEQAVYFQLAMTEMTRHVHHILLSGNDVISLNQGP